MKYLYLNNFRGFQDTLVELKDVNFLVGENSSGKTSVLGVLNNLANSDFWNLSKFSDDPIDFGNFRDMISTSSKNKSNFEIGLIDEDTQHSKNYSAFAFNFISKDGVPFIKELRSFSSGFEIIAKVTDKSLKYKVIEYGKLDSLEALKNKFFKKRKNNNVDNNDFIPVENFNFRFVSPGYIIPLIVAADFLKKGTTPDIISSKSFQRLMVQRNFFCFAPVRSKPKRTYDKINLNYSSEGEHIPFILNNLFEKKDNAIFDKISKFGKQSGLFEAVIVNKFKGSSSQPFELQISLNNACLNFKNVGYGIPQILPVLVEILRKEKDTGFAVQQPEVHLHPKAQAALGDLFFELASKENKKFFIETHSDYIIDRFRIKLRKQKKKTINSQILFFERTKKGNKIHAIEINENGDISDKQPKKYRDFFIKEGLELLGL